MDLKPSPNIEPRLFARHAAKPRRTTMAYRLLSCLILAGMIAVVLNGAQALAAEETAQHKSHFLGKTSSFGVPVKKVAGERRIAVVLLNLASNPTTPWDLETVRDRIFTGERSVSSFYQEESWGQVSLTGDVYGWYTLPDPSSACEPRTWLSEAQALARQNGVTVAKYQHVVFIVAPRQHCSWAGRATIGGRTIWINANINLGTIIHEFGHNFGLLHPRALSCTDRNGSPAWVSDNCGEKPYAKPYAVTGTQVSQHNGYQKLQMGFIRPSSLLTVDMSGRYQLVPIEQNATGRKQVIRVARGQNPNTGQASSYYYLDFRQPFGFFDSFNSSDPVVNGVSLWLGGEYSARSVPSLLDTTPETTEVSDAALVGGRSIKDTKNGVEVSTVSVNPDGATVDIKVPRLTARRLRLSPKKVRIGKRRRAQFNVSYQISKRARVRLMLQHLVGHKKGKLRRIWSGLREPGKNTLRISLRIKRPGLYRLKLLASRGSEKSSINSRLRLIRGK